jgi:hypothetical protein
LVRLPLYVSVLRALRVALCVLVAALLVLGDLQAALIVAVFVGLSFAHLLRSDRRPAFFDVLFALAALAGALGFAFGLFEEIDRPLRRADPRLHDLLRQPHVLLPVLQGRRT